MPLTYSYGGGYDGGEWVNQGWYTDEAGNKIGQASASQELLNQYQAEGFAYLSQLMQSGMAPQQVLDELVKNDRIDLAFHAAQNGLLPHDLTVNTSLLPINSQAQGFLPNGLKLGEWNAAQQTHSSHDRFTEQFVPAAAMMLSAGGAGGMIGQGLGLSGTTGAAAGGAIIGGASSALTGGNPIQGAVLGGASAAAGDYLLGSDGLVNAGGDDALLGGTGADNLTMMPAATPEADPTFGGALTPTGNGVYESTFNPGLTTSGVGPQTGGSDGTQPPGSPDGGSSGGTGGGGTGGGSSISKILTGTATIDDYIKVFGTAGATLFGIYGSGEKADELQELMSGIQQQYKPFLDASTGWLADPKSFFEGPGKAALAANMNAVSVHGNPATSPWALQTANDAAMKNWADTVYKFGHLGTGGTNATVNLGTGVANANADQLNALGYGLGQITNPPTSLEDLLKQLPKSTYSGVTL